MAVIDFPSEENEESAENTKQNDEVVLGKTATVALTSINPNKEVPALVDTGATFSSLHAKNIRLNDGKDMTSFECEVLSDKLITMNVVKMISVKNAEATEYRPVIKLSINLNGKFVPDVLFTLNDRDGMDHPILIGEDLIKRVGAKIDIKQEHVEKEPTADVENLNEDVVQLYSTLIRECFHRKCESAKAKPQYDGEALLFTIDDVMGILDEAVDIAARTQDNNEIVD